MHNDIDRCRLLIKIEWISTFLMAILSKYFCRLLYCSRCKIKKLSVYKSIHVSFFNMEPVT